MEPSFDSRYRKNLVQVPEIIQEASGIRIFGQLLKSFLFSTDVALIRNTNANAIIAVYPFTAQPARIRAGVDILNVSGAENTPAIIEKIRRFDPDIAIIATGGKTEQSIRETLEAGANAISYTPPSTAELFREVMQRYRAGG